MDVNIKLEQLMKVKYSVLINRDETTNGNMCFLASHPELVGCMAHGDTQEEALASLEKAKRLYLETLLEKNIEIPLPQSLPDSMWLIADADIDSKSGSESDDLQILEVSPVINCLEKEDMIYENTTK